MENENSILSIFIREFNKFSIDTFRILKNKPEFQQEEQIYHYTSLFSMQKMIENESFRASSIYMLNDPSELFYGRDQIINWYYNGSGLKNRIKLEPESAYVQFPAFVFSLTELSDDMHFWDKYGDNHQGIRIGFTPTSLTEYWNKLQNIVALLVPVVYQDYDGSFLGEYADSFKKFKIEVARTINEIISKRELSNEEFNQLHYFNSVIASFIKRKEWSHEKEWRILCIPQGFMHEAIIGDFSTGKSIARLENKTPETLKLLTNKGHNGVAFKDVLKVGSLAGDVEYIKYSLQLLMKKQTGTNYFNDNISQSIINFRRI